jgi:hypothetical protein
MILTILEPAAMTGKATDSTSPERLAQLLAMGLRDHHSGGNPGDTETLTEVLDDMLDAQLPLDPTLPNSLPTVLNWTSEEVLSAARRSIRELLLVPETHLDVIATLKNYSKGLVRRATPGDEKTAVRVIYYAAIATGLVFHGRKITRHSFETLHGAFTELDKKTWIPSDLKDLFAQAQAVCRQHKNGTG